MGIVIRPASFAGRAGAAEKSRARRQGRLIDGRLAALAVAAIGLASILALAGTAFAVRAAVVLCFAAAADRRRPEDQSA